MNNFNNMNKAVCLTVLGLMLSSCELLGPKRAAKIPLTPVLKERASSLEDSVTFKELQNKPPVNDALKSKIELYPARDRFAPQTESHRRSTKTGGPGTYSLNFDDADLGEVAKVILSDILGQNYVLSPKVTGKVTLNTSEPLSKEELLPTLEMVLGMNNAALVKDGKIYHIEPKAEALYSSTIAGDSTGFQSRVIPIRNVAAQEIADILKPIVHEKTILNVDNNRNSLMVQGTADELARVMDMVSTFDIDVLKGRSFALFPLNHVEPDKIIEELETVFNTSSGKEDSEFFRFLPIERMNAVLAITHQASYLRDIENWVFRLDRANTESGGGVNVYKVQHMDAEELAGTLSEIFTGAAPRDKSAKVAAGKKSAEVSNKDSTDGSQPTGKTSVSRKKSKPEGSRKASGSGGGSDDNETKIVADIANNSLVIIATPQEYGKILPIIKQLDIMPLQVLIDATIVSVTLTDKLQYGISWYLKNGPGNDAIGSNKGTLGTTDTAGTGAVALGTAAQAAAAAATGGLSTVYSSGSIKALLDAESNLNNINVISSPSLMVLNNQEATIHVGDEISLTTGNVGNLANPSVGNPTSGSGNLLTQNQQRKTGLTLTVTPRVNANGMVIMDIKQTVEDVDNNNRTAGGNPTILSREIESSVAVQTEETLVLGGLIRDQNSNTKNGIPFLHELPLIGSLFGATSKNENKTELVILITPRVVKTKQDARIVTDEFKRKLSGIYYDPTKPKKKEKWWTTREW
ncbi:type II secretion system secretin GspD [Methyloglobulus sp.]|uniref:type II secretion system secretin GspD n=1 Tax=Methyloglobulus sp. TaxID=2518622 RepID=UPI0032B76408